MAKATVKISGRAVTCSQVTEVSVESQFVDGTKVHTVLALLSNGDYLREGSWPDKKSAQTRRDALVKEINITEHESRLHEFLLTIRDGIRTDPRRWYGSYVRSCTNAGIMPVDKEVLAKGGRAAEVALRPIIEREHRPRLS